MTLLNTEIENSIVMNGARIDCGKKITDSLIGKAASLDDPGLEPTGAPISPKA